MTNHLKGEVKSDYTFVLVFFLNLSYLSNGHHKIMNQIDVHKTGAPLEWVPRVYGNPSILGKTKQNSKIFRKSSLF